MTAQLLQEAIARLKTYLDLLYNGSGIENYMYDWEEEAEKTRELIEKLEAQLLAL